LTLIGPDFALRDITIAPSEIVEWTVSDGVRERGLLTLPQLNWGDGRFPLVIQFYNFMPNVFRPDGPAPGAYAAQALAARGIAVLGVNLAISESRGETGTTRREGPSAVQTIDAAVEALAARRLVDPNRVGLLGFSRGGYYSLYAITHPGRIRPAAAIAWDSVTTNFGEYVDRAARSFPAYNVPTGISAPHSIEGQMALGQSVVPFWSNKVGWLQESPEFNIDRIQTPFLAAMNGLSLLHYDRATNLLGLFALAHRPFELVNVPYGPHPYVRPRERAASMRVTVDWMGFWLRNQYDPDPAKHEQYARWREMRTRWQRQQAWEATGHAVGSTPPADFNPADR
jgi:dipeptidyl aminopeptidase/acylaminoacyl peptidase